jgi:hypothetical protein
MMVSSKVLTSSPSSPPPCFSSLWMRFNSGICCCCSAVWRIWACYGERGKGPERVRCYTGIFDRRHAPCRPLSKSQCSSRSMRSSRPCSTPTKSPAQGPAALWCWGDGGRGGGLRREGMRNTF